jgi:hypothetical protein
LGCGGAAGVAVRAVGKRAVGAVRRPGRSGRTGGVQVPGGGGARKKQALARGGQRVVGSEVWVVVWVVSGGWSVVSGGQRVGR